MSTTTVTPSVWIGCLNAYNCGHLHGEWVDATLGVEHLEEARDRVIRTSPGDSPEEWFLADNEGFGGTIGEYTPLSTVAELAEKIEEHGEAFIAYLGLGLGDDEGDSFEDRFRGHWDSEKDYGYDYVDGIGLLADVPDEVTMYFDYDSYARDLFMGGSLTSVDAGSGVYVFDTCG